MPIKHSLRSRNRHFSLQNLPTTIRVKGEGMWPFHRVMLEREFGSLFNFNAIELPTKYISKTELEAEIAPEHITEAGTYQLRLKPTVKFCRSKSGASDRWLQPIGKAQAMTPPGEPSPGGFLWRPRNSLRARIAQIRVGLFDLSAPELFDRLHQRACSIARLFLHRCVPVKRIVARGIRLHISDIGPQLR